MRFLRLTIALALLTFPICWLGLRPALAPASPAGPQQPGAQAPATASGVIKAEANLVLVDAIVTDKKGNYVHDLEQKDFHVFEDGKEQPITAFSPPSALTGPSAPRNKRYLVLFFDNSTMDAADQMRARQAAGQFIEKTASSDRLMAVVDFTGTLQLAQNFTADSDALKRAVANVKFSTVQPNAPGQTTEIASLGLPTLAQVESDFGARSVLLAIREVAKNLRSVPGRKILILFSAGFPLNPERESELAATIDAANKANVAIYPLDVRGLMAPGVSPGVTNPLGQPVQPGLPQGSGAYLDGPAFPHESALLASLLGGLGPPQALAQRPPGGGGGAGGGGGVGGGGGGGRGGGGGIGGGSTGGGAGAGGSGRGGSTGGGRNSGGTSTGGSRGTSGGGARGGGGGAPLGYNQPRYQYPPRAIIPPFLESASTNQQVLYALAVGTGGFTIFNTNDFLGGLDKINKELQEYYILGYVPPNTPREGSYHKLQVNVDRPGLKVRSRNGYYDLRSSDLLAGKAEGKALEERAASPLPGNIPLSLRCPYFYPSGNVARVNLALDIPAGALNFEKEKKDFHAEINVLGIASREDGTVAARFSDTAKLDLDKKELKEFTKGRYPYRNTFDITPGKYNLKVVLSAGGQSFGKYEMPLVIEPYDGKQLHLSALALSNEIHPVSELQSNLDAALLEDHTPLTAKTSDNQELQLLPSSTNRFSRSDKVGLYVEVYEPLLQTNDPPRVGVILNVIDRKTNQQVYTSNTILINSFAVKGNPVIPVAVSLPVEQLQAGDYRLEVLARDAAGNTSAKHSAEFALD